MSKENEILGHTSKKGTDSLETFVCPVYRKSVSQPHFIEEGWYFIQKTCIMSSRAILEHEYPHYYYEEDICLDESHFMTAVISAESDDQDVPRSTLEIRPCDMRNSSRENTLRTR